MRNIRRIYALFLMVMISSVYAEENQIIRNDKSINCNAPHSSEYPAIKDKNDIITFSKNQNPEYNTQDKKEIKVYRTNCDDGTGSVLAILRHGMISEHGKIIEAFFYDNDLIIIYQAPYHSKVIPYTSDQYITFTYTKDNVVYFPADKLHSFLSNGADILVSNSKGYIYPYKTKEAVIKGLSSRLYKEYVNNRKIIGKIENKTKFEYVANYLNNTERYIDKGKEFEVIGISGGWLNIEYLDKVKPKVIGWVMCKDTNLCDKTGIPL